MLIFRDDFIDETQIAGRGIAFSQSYPGLIFTPASVIPFRIEVGCGNLFGI
jgi:hypothetical protein